MLEAIYGELARIVAKELYNYAKFEGGRKLRDFKRSTALLKSGKGFPEPVLLEFEKAFIAALEELKWYSDGYACWRHNGSEINFYFLLEDRFIGKINETNWAAVSKQTAEGVKQVNAIGGEDVYNDVLDRTINSLFRLAIKKCIGRPIGDYSLKVIIHSPVLKMEVAPEGSDEFSHMCIFYKSCNDDEGELIQEHKLAKNLITGSFLKKAAPPSKGPYLTQE